MNRRLRSCAALLAIAAMLFAPLAMALYACPFAGDMVAAAQALAADEAAGASMDMAACEQHCTQAKASFDLAKPPAPMAAPFVAPVRVAALAPLRVAEPAFRPGSAFAAGPAPPLARTTVLRI
jgi:hypothetical protein